MNSSSLSPDLIYLAFPDNDCKILCSRKKFLLQYGAKLHLWGKRAWSVYSRLSRKELQSSTIRFDPQLIIKASGEEGAAPEGKCSNRSLVP